MQKSPCLLVLIQVLSSLTLIQFISSCGVTTQFRVRNESICAKALVVPEVRNIRLVGGFQSLQLSWDSDALGSSIPVCDGLKSEMKLLFDVVVYRNGEVFAIEPEIEELFLEIPNVDLFGDVRYSAQITPHISKKFWGNTRRTEMAVHCDLTFGDLADIEMEPVDPEATEYHFRFEVPEIRFTTCAEGGMRFQWVLLVEGTEVNAEELNWTMIDDQTLGIFGPLPEGSLELRVNVVWFIQDPQTGNDVVVISGEPTSLYFSL